MRVVVLGAQTPLGQEVVDDLLFRGHTPTAVIDHRSDTAFGSQHPVSTARGDITDPSWLKVAVVGTEAVVDVLSMTGARGAAVRSQAATRHLMETMTAHQVRRYVGIVPNALYPPAHGSPRIERVRWEVREALRPQDVIHTRERFQEITTSPLSWTIVRAPALRTGPARGVRHVYVRPGPAATASLTQVDAARFLAAQVLETNLLRTTPLISN